MNTLERRLFVKRRVIALAVAKEARNEALLQQGAASSSRKKLATQRAARNAVNSQPDPSHYPDLRQVS
jgi:hypothetical protein